MDSLFSFFFKYRFFFFQQGDFTFQWMSLWLPALFLFLMAASVLFVLYRRRWVGLRSNPGRPMLALRLALLVFLAFLILRPSLVLSTLVPKENIVALLVDNSRSMGIVDEFEPRGAVLKEILSEDSDFIQGLDERFYVRPYRFDAEAGASRLPLQLEWTGEQSNIVGALERILADSRNLPMGALVLFSDGADNSFRSFSEVVAELKARQIPVYAVGLGPEEISRDVEITNISAPRVLLPESMATVRVTLRQRGFGGSRGRLEVREGGSLLESQEVYFPPESETVNAELTLGSKSEGIKTFQFTFEPLEGERIVENNTRSTLIQVRDSQPKILYVEGHPRWEYKFIRQSLSQDQNLKLETLLRTALNKFYRQGIDEETTLAAGFPSDPEELFSYQGLIVGSIESSFFTYAQMELLRDFVGKRGGGLLMLGGNSSFSGGKYRNTPVEQVLPVWLHQDAEPPPAVYEQGLAVLEVSPHGERYPALKLAAEGKTLSEQWAEMPPLTDWNLVRDLKPGTTVLASLRHTGSELPLMAIQRFGRGQSMAFLTGSSWRWQMLRDSRDTSHEVFWRQVLRWLVGLAKDPVSVETDRESYSRSELVSIRAEVNDPAFNRINDALVEARIISPDGQETTIPLAWSAEEDGIYEAGWPAGAEGRTEVVVEARRTGQKAEPYGSGRTSLLVATGSKEFFGASQRKDFLQRLADETGGRYYSVQDVTHLPEEIVYTQRQSSVLEVLDLWDMPVNLMILLALLLAEWGLRKRHGTI